MTDNPAFHPPRHALASDTAALSCSRNKLVSTVRAQCADLPVGIPLVVAGHRLMWMEAEWGQDTGNGLPLIKGHTQMMLLVDDDVLDALALTEARSPDAGNGIDADRSGYTEGWFVVGVCQKYQDMLRDQRIDPDTLRTMAPYPFCPCGSTALREVASALPTAMSLWQAQRIADLEAQATRVQALAAWLRGTNANRR